MLQYRYHRLARNDTGWKHPHPGRLGTSDDYVGNNGFGFEDWNFSHDIADDGRHHLYLRSKPAEADLGDTFNIALGSRSSIGHFLVGFIENVEIASASFSQAVWERRAEQLEDLVRCDSLDGEFKEMSQRKMAKTLKNSEEFVYAVSPANLHILKDPLLIPEEIVSKDFTRYQLKSLGKDHYFELKGLCSLPSDAHFDDESFPEGKLVERRHRSRERNSRLANLAKSEFRARNDGKLFCEACNWPQSKKDLPSPLEDCIIEAHHDVPLSSSCHAGETKISDLKMLCPNCHRALHRERPWKTVGEFRKRYFQ